MRQLSVVPMKQPLDVTPDLNSIEADRMLITQAASYVNNLWQQMNAAETYIAAGKEFKNLQEHLNKNKKEDKTRIGWHRAFSKKENRFGISRQHAETYIDVFEAFFKTANMLAVSSLPQSLRPLHALAKLQLDATQLRGCINEKILGPHSTENDIKKVAEKFGLAKKKRGGSKRQPIPTIPAKTAPKRERIEAAFELLTRLGLSLDDLEGQVS